MVWIWLRYVVAMIVLLGIFGAAVLGEIVGLLAAVALGNSDPTIWMTTIAGVGVGVIALGFIAFANVTSMANILYTSVVGLRQVGTDGIRQIGWGALLFGFCVIPLGLVVAYPQMYDGFFIFLVWTSALNSALAGIGIADYFFLRDNPKGIIFERWRHIHGCGRFFNAARDTISDKILLTYKAGEPMPDPATLVAPSASKGEKA